jgi:hypothetical protein
MPYNRITYTAESMSRNLIISMGIYGVNAAAAWVQMGGDPNIALHPTTPHPGVGVYMFQLQGGVGAVDFATFPSVSSATPLLSSHSVAGNVITVYVITHAGVATDLVAGELLFLQLLISKGQ